MASPPRPAAFPFANPLVRCPLDGRQEPVIACMHPEWHGFLRMSGGPPHSCSQMAHKTDIRLFYILHPRYNLVLVFY